LCFAISHAITLEAFALSLDPTGPLLRPRSAIEALALANLATELTVGSPFELAALFVNLRLRAHRGGSLDLGLRLRSCRRRVLDCGPRRAGWSRSTWRGRSVGRWRGLRSRRCIAFMLVLRCGKTASRQDRGKRGRHQQLILH